ncbi:LEAF RUST 10 DISEASE-RESISTANCE LOCUS RECEPTOR-LIKE PROTEIN KINASE-like 1.2 isoform X2 [Iris pallida]|uniref:LEAF RUST 10 DISEASE-RESISTANCE LOCUS RECEPTOR-LIKE PROTEIN KINASE-like 1.2 isoform X2 n=1 Tax=Iris pallida TaxID=29817 RepID=A0AAX6DW14_IRIPA|nr:LEAF RUST 10 DISEASE-RESISTANCE LOCUS RECEPTOR-LIKE PROTEIN KINASE-like 1.2 isoform X2 [Iris pallida]KAJ6824954.1 LEAF RUST 10 DISEASE-RESISTANCE LOCUS RECEPTOR-LIKE PROTEIN KINASE-like 1.2 isoform X2 [Iris pallida]
MPRPAYIHCGLRRYKLHQHYSKTINITLVSQLIALVVLRIHIPWCALRGSGHMGSIQREEPR